MMLIHKKGKRQGEKRAKGKSSKEENYVASDKKRELCAISNSRATLIGAIQKKDWAL